MPGLPQNNNISKLSFSATENIRNLMLVKNLPDPDGSGPYGEFSPSSYRQTSLREQAVEDQPTVDEAGEPFIYKAYLDNRYGPVGGFGDFVNITTASQSNPQVNEGVYPSFNTPQTPSPILGQNIFNNIGRYYSPTDILLSVNVEGLLSGALLDDSELAQVGAQTLRKQLVERIQQELFYDEQKNNGLVNSVQNPVTAGDILTGKQPANNRDTRITKVPAETSKGVDFLSRISGQFTPYSLIPGDYFDIDPPRGEGLVNSTVNRVTNFITSTLGIARKTKSSSDVFLQNTAEGTRSFLFKQLKYNNYGPQYGNEGRAQGLVSSIIGQGVDAASNGLLGFENTPPNPPQYIGSQNTNPTDLTSPPLNTYSGKNYVPLFGPDAVAKEFDQVRDKFGLNGNSFTNQGTVDGGFTWFSSARPPGTGNLIGGLFTPNNTKFGVQNPGTSQGREGNTRGTDAYITPPFFSRSLSNDKSFRADSILGVTQNIVDSIPGGAAKLRSSSHAINQVSKVFNDGYKEITKGSRVKRFENTDPTNGRGVEREREYCRIWTKDVPYYKFDRLQKSDGNTRKETYSVLDKTFNLNIAPFRTDETGKGSTNIVDGKVKKYMFSIENLAWRTSRKKGSSYDDLPSCEKGPNGGRIMWFPPYGLSVDDTSSANFSETKFVGRPEPIYTYNSTSRSGSLSFKIVVDHPSILNLLVRKELARLQDTEVDAILDSFFAGCKKYDIFDLARKWQQFSVNELAEIQNELNRPEISVNTVTEISQDSRLASTPQESTPQAPAPNYTQYDNIILGFLADEPAGTSSITTDVQYQDFYEQFIGESNNESLKSEVQTQYTRFQELAKKLREDLSTGNYQIDIILNGNGYHNSEDSSYLDGIRNSGGTIDDQAWTEYAENIAQRRISSVRQMFEFYEDGGENFFQKFIQDGVLTFTPTTSNTDRTSQDTDGNGLTPQSVQILSYDITVLRDPTELIPIPDTPNPVDVRQGEGIRPNTEQFIKERNRNTRREIANKILSKLVTECDYFDLIKEENEFIYNSLKEKFKFFHPAFHAITPEGLNSRLTFLQQCVRPGDTIPTRSIDGSLNSSIDAKNTSFGTPPVLVLRIGDFVNTKIIPGTLSITFDDNTLDLNPEGIGVQPMIATVSLSFNYIGGQGIKGPVEQLQNALSFNFYANTEFYDDRAIFTVTDEDPDEQRFIRENDDLIGQTQGTGSNNPIVEQNNVNNTQNAGNDGETIGVKSSSVLDTDTTVIGSGTTSGDTGFITYGGVFDDFNKSARNYVVNSFERTEQFLQNNSIYSLNLYYNNPKLREGKYYIGNGTQQTSSTPYDESDGLLFGINGDDMITQLDTIKQNYLIKINAETTYIQTQFINSDSAATQIQKEDLKSYLTTQLNTQLDELIRDQLEDYSREMSEYTLDYTRGVTKLNVISDAGDGFRTDGNTTTLEISGTTEVYETSNQTNTLLEFANDYKSLTNVLTIYSKAFGAESTAGESNIVTKNLVNINNDSINIFGLDSNISYEIFIFYNDLIDKQTIDSLGGDYSIFKENNQQYIDGNTGDFYSGLQEALKYETEPTWISDLRQTFNEQIVEAMNPRYTTIVNGRTNYVDKITNQSNEFITKGSDNTDLGTEFNGNVDLPQNKERKFSYEEKDNNNLTEVLLNYWNQRNSNDNTFNFKFT